MQTSSSPLVLIAEDDPNDVFLLRRAFQQAEVSSRIIDVPNGLEAIRYLSADNCECSIPDLLLLDLKMPLLNGFDVLLWLQNKPQLSEMPAVVLSSSFFDLDMKRARELGARDYQVKPHSSSELLNLVREISSRWLTLGPQLVVQPTSAYRAENSPRIARFI